MQQPQQQQQQQSAGLKPCGDHKPPVSSSFHRRGGATSSTKKMSGGNGREAFLATDVTTLDINTMFHSKKSKRNGASEAPAAGAVPMSAPPSPTTAFPFLGGQSGGFTFPSYINTSSIYTNFDLFAAAASANGDHLPSLMSMPAYKPLGYNIESPVMDFAQFTEELKALQQNHHHHYNNNNANVNNHQNSHLHPLLASSTAVAAANVDAHQFPPKSLTYGAVSSSRNGGGPNGRKNRMVEVKTINDRSVVVVSDPQSATATSRQHVVHLNRQGFPVDHLTPIEMPKQKRPPISSEPVYSRKVFIGGLPIDVTEEEVWTTFGAFGKVLVDWPRRPEHGSRGDGYDHMEMGGRRNARSVSGYVFLVFQSEPSVQELVNACELYEDKYYLQLSSPTMSDKAVQVRAWRLSDIDYFGDENSLVDHRRTVFIGGVPRPTRASDLARALQDHYGKVSYVGIDIDPELKYPKGAARVTFATSASFVSAISGRFVNVMHAESNKRVEIKPYMMEEQHCDECLGQLCKHNYASYFCGDASCLQYYCEACWDRMHYSENEYMTRADHRPMIRNGDQTKVLNTPPHHRQQHPTMPPPPSHFYHRTSSSSSLSHARPSPPSLLFRSGSTTTTATTMSSEYPPATSQPQNSSFISRIVARNPSSSPPSSGTYGGAKPSQKPFSAVPTTIGY